MRVLAVTGRLAERDVRRYAKGADVLVIGIDVAAFITPKHLQNLDLSGYDLVLVPGLTSGNWAELEERKGVKIRLGPIHAYDLQFLMPSLEKIELSHTIPACRLVKEKKAQEILDLVNGIQDFSFKIGDVPVGGRSRMKIVAEIVDSTKLSEEELVKKARYYERSGADIIDLGLPLEVRPEEVESVIGVARSACRVPLSVDTFDIQAIEAAVNAGIDMIMSVSKENLEALDLVDDQAVVVVERDLGILMQLIEKAKERTERVIADPVLDPPLRLAESILRYRRFRELDSETPLLYGIGNVTELTDSDSIGINAVLALIAEELKASVLFTTEASPKTAGSVKELFIASYMAKAARLRNAHPKDLGLDLLVIKEKTKFQSCLQPEKALEAKERKEFVRDPLGDFRIWVVEDRILCSHEKLTVAGRNAKEVYDTAIERNLISRLDHACYLGKELMKAEIALKLGKNYVQDRDLDFGIYCDEGKKPRKHGKNFIVNTSCWEDDGYR
jgi:dihydropteroate synthase-like protein